MTEPPAPRPPGPQRTNPLAIVGLVLAIPFWPAGLVLSAIAYFQIRRTGEEGGVLAVLGLILSTVFAAIFLGMSGAGPEGADPGNQLRDDLQELQRRMEEQQRHLLEEGLPLRPEELRRPGDPSSP